MRVYSKSCRDVGLGHLATEFASSERQRCEAFFLARTGAEWAEITLAGVREPQVRMVSRSEMD
jgi:hypothetical protein